MTTASVNTLPAERTLPAEDPSAAELFNVPQRPLRAYHHWKNLLDRATACLLLIPGVPMIAVLMVIIKLSSRGPAIYSQQRVGKDGRIYTMYKLRSMRSDAEAKSGPVWCAAGHDPRITRLGYWLRKLHLDELPQLFNVARGEMSLIGPRPERPEFVRVLGESVPRYMERLRVVPGITGLAQINLPPDTDLNSVRRKVKLDLEYIETASFLLDARIFCSTVFRIVGIKGNWAMRIMWLTRNVTLNELDEHMLHAENHEVTPQVIAEAVSEDEVLGNS